MLFSGYHMGIAITVPQQLAYTSTVQVYQQSSMDQEDTYRALLFLAELLEYRGGVVIDLRFIFTSEPTRFHWRVANL